MVIREAVEEDLQILRDFAYRIFDLSFANANSPQAMGAYMDEAFSFKSIKENFFEPGSIFLLAFEIGKVIGYSRLRLNNEVDHFLGPNNIELQRLYVDVPFQGKGVADGLMKASLDFGKKHNNEWIWLGVWENNLKAQRYYKKWGFEKFSEHVFRMGNEQQTDWLMKKKLVG